VGDWWAFGESRYGDRKALVTSDGWEGPKYQTCMDAAWVSRKFAKPLDVERLHGTTTRKLPPSIRKTRTLCWTSALKKNGQGENYAKPPGYGRPRAAGRKYANLRTYPGRGARQLKLT
jgi:hypothetical protein